MEVNMLDSKRTTTETPYATNADFCQIFSGEMNGLYLLAFLLTADREKAEQCFVSGLEDAVQGNPVFKEWARSWARRVIIQNAVRLIKPQPAERNGRSRSGSVNGNDQPAAQQVEVAAVLALEPFERFVYVMTVLERYSDHECSLLLGCGRRDVIDARTRALRELGSSIERLHNQLSNDKPETPRARERRSSVFELPITPRLVTAS
jgi:hypothetical protein